jgi:glycosyltransferase involved in cell wall biosynthesis
MPTVSVIIPTFNHASYLAAALRSVLAQTHQDFEVILVDDGSTDDPASVATSLGDSRIGCVRQENAGLAAARNTGIRHARSPFVAFLDADDEFRPRFLEQALHHFDHLPPTFGVVACNRIRMDDGRNPLPERKAPARTDREITGKEILIRNRFVAEVVARREVFDRCGFFDTALRSSEDRDMWVRISIRYRIFLAATPQLLIRRMEGSMSRHADRMKTNMRRVIDKAWAARLASRFDVPFWLQVLSMNAYEVAWMHHDEGRSLRALAGLARSAALWPVFWNHRAVAEPLLFRIRAARHFLLGALRGSPQPTDTARRARGRRANKPNP